MFEAKKDKDLKRVSELYDEVSDEQDSFIAIIKTKRKANVNSNFGIFFYKEFSRATIEHNLSTTDLVVFLSILDHVAFGNLVNLSQATIARSLGLKQQQVSRSVIKLDKAGILLRSDGSTYINPNYMCVGDLNKATESEAYKIALNRKYREIEATIPDLELPKLNEKVHKSMSFSKQ